MKKIIVFLLCSLPTFLFSQDIITMQSGEIIESKVLEIEISKIKYKKFNNLEGPSYTIEKDKVHKIRYSNGTEEIINDLRAEKKMYIWCSEVSSLPKKEDVYVGRKILITINDHRKFSSKVVNKCTSEGLIDIIIRTIRNSFPNASIELNTKKIASVDENGVKINIDLLAYNTVFYPAYWTAYTQYDVSIEEKDKTVSKYIFKEKGGFNVWGYKTGKKMQQESFDAANEELLNFILNGK